MKAGGAESYQEEFLGSRTWIYFTHLREEQIQSHQARNGFRVLALDRRAPYKEEKEVLRSFAIAENG